VPRKLTRSYPFNAYALAPVFLQGFWKNPSVAARPAPAQVGHGPDDIRPPVGQVPQGTAEAVICTFAGPQLRPRSPAKQQAQDLPDVQLAIQGEEEPNPVAGLCQGGVTADKEVPFILVGPGGAGVRAVGQGPAGLERFLRNRPEPVEREV